MTIIAISPIIPATIPIIVPADPRFMVAARWLDQDMEEILYYISFLVLVKRDEMYAHVA